MISTDRFLDSGACTVGTFAHICPLGLLKQAEKWFTVHIEKSAHTRTAAISMSATHPLT